MRIISTLNGVYIVLADALVANAAKTSADIILTRSHVTMDVMAYME